MSENVTVTTIEALRELIGRELGVSDWVEITQERVNQFADATGDHQFIHVDPDRAAETPYEGTIAHGYLTLSMLPELSRKRHGVQVDLGGKMAINYGLNRVRFPAPVRVGRKVRVHTLLINVDEIGNEAVHITYQQTVEVEDEDKPACIAETLTRIYF